MEQKNQVRADDAQSTRRLGLVLDRHYRVTRQFSDADGRRHPVGEEWTLVGSKFSRFEDEHVISVRFASGETLTFGLICEEPEQYEVVRHFCDYVSEI